MGKRPYLPLQIPHLHFLSLYPQLRLQHRLLPRQKLLWRNNGSVVIGLDEHEQLAVNLQHPAHGFEFEQEQRVALQQAVESAVGFFAVEYRVCREAFAFCADVAVAAASVQHLPEGEGNGWAGFVVEADTAVVVTLGDGCVADADRGEVIEPVALFGFVELGKLGFELAVEEGVEGCVERVWSWQLAMCSWQSKKLGGEEGQ